MKRALVGFTIVLAVIAVAAAGQMPPECHPGEHHGEGDLAAYLQLTDAQRATWESAHSNFTAAIQPLLTKNRDLEGQIHAAVTAASPDATAIGNLLIASHAIHEQIRTAREGMLQQLQSTLTPEQKAKFDAHVSAMQHMEHMHAE